MPREKKASVSAVEGHKTNIRKALRKKPQTLDQLAARIGTSRAYPQGVKRQHLAGAIVELVGSGDALKVSTKPAGYYKP